jgi:stage V sporulation protein SpoVS
MKNYLPIAVLAGTMTLAATAHNGPWFIDLYVVPPPKHPVLDFRLEFFDADDGQNLGDVIVHADGSTFVKETVTPNTGTKRIKMKFAPLDIDGLQIRPVDRIVELSPAMHAKTITWLATVTADKAYLDNVTTATTSLKKKDVDEAIDRAAYAGAVATSANQRLEAARIEANGNLANNDAYSALAVFSRVAEEGIDKADPSKKKVFIGEWLDVLDQAAKAEGTVPDKDTGLIFPSLASDSRLREAFNRFLEVFAAVIPTYQAKSADLAKSDIAGREKLVRKELSTIIADLSRQPKASR